jgi:hypothetical protein
MPHSRVGVKIQSQVKGFAPSSLQLALLLITGFNLFVLQFSEHNDTTIALLGLNLLASLVYVMLRKAPSAPSAGTDSFSIQDTIDHVHHTIQQILHAYVEQHQLEYQLSLAHASLEQFHKEQEQMVSATTGEVNKQYQNILAYAHYLEERIAVRRIDASVRHDYDEVCEQAFNLQLVVQAMGMVPSHIHAPALGIVPVADRMASILLDLTPSLDRRAMKLTTATWDETIHVISNAEWLTHTLWMMLLGCIRFAEDESTLALSCTKDGARARIDVTVSFLSAGALSETERFAYLQKRMHSDADEAHMFASTLDGHANIQLGKMLATRMGAQLFVSPRDTNSCTLTLLLPCAQ